MIQLKSEQDIESLAAGGKLLAEVLDELEAMVEPGMTGLQLEDVAQVRMKEMGVTPAFQGYASGGHDPYPFALCVSVNEAVVHGMPNDAPFDEGDIVGVDAGLVYEDKYYLDSARTIPVGTVTNEAKNLLDITKESLSIGIAEATVGAYVGDIGAAVQEYVEGQGLQVVRQLVGHGVGFGVHEPPQVPNFGKRGKGEILEEGLVIAIEPMVVIGDATVVTAADGWTVESRSGALSAHFEHTVAVTKDGPRILTT